MNISKELLVHSAISKRVVGIDADRQPVFSEPQILDNIYINMDVARTDGTVGFESSDNGMMFFDCANSTPEEYVPQMGDCVIFENKEYTVHSIKKCYGLNGLEHYEIGLK